jgi:ribokinase
MAARAGPDILGIGVLAVDEMLHVKAYPPPDEKARVLRVARACGGLIGTSLAAAASLGARCAYAGVLGRNELSDYIRGAMEGISIDCSRVTVQEGAIPVHSTIICDDTSHTRNIFFDIGGIRPLPPETDFEPLLRGAKVLLIDQLGMEGMIRAAGVARRLGIPVVADMEWPEDPRLEELMALVDHLILSRSFAARVSGASEAAESCRRLHARSGRACTAVTCGAEGSFFIAGPKSVEVQHQPAFQVKVTETTGCGDVFHGAYAAAVAAGKDVQGCIRLATAAAAVFASRPSGWQNLPAAKDVANLLG